MILVNSHLIYIGLTKRKVQTTADQVVLTTRLFLEYPVAGKSNIFEKTPIHFTENRGFLLL